MAISVYRFTKGFPREEMYGLASQMRVLPFQCPATLQKGMEDWVPTNTGSFSELRAGRILNYRRSLRLREDWE